MFIDHIRDLEEFKTFFTARALDDGGQYPIMHVINNPHLYCFYNETGNNELQGYIFITQNEEGKLFLSGAAIRKNMPENVKAIIKICEAFPCEMYSNTDKKEAIILLLKSGFKKLDTNLYVRTKNGKKQISTWICNREL